MSYESFRREKSLRLIFCVIWLVVRESFGFYDSSKGKMRMEKWRNWKQTAFETFISFNSKYSTCQKIKLGSPCSEPQWSHSNGRDCAFPSTQVLIWCLWCASLPMKFAFLSEKENEYPKSLYSEIVHSPFSECLCKVREHPAMSTRGIITRAYSNLTLPISLMPFALNTCEIEVYLQKNFLTHSLQSSKCYYRCLLQTKVGKFWCP